MDTLWEKDNFINENNPYMFNTEIIEYDMKEAGYSLTREFQLLDKNRLKSLERLDKNRRHVTIGMIQRDNPEYKKALGEMFKEARRMFFEFNEIEKNDIVSIKKDAIFVKKRCDVQKFGEYINFRPKNFYSSYINLGKRLEFYYGMDTLDIKGISDDKLEYHQDYMIAFIKRFIRKMETSTPNETIGFTKRFLDKYKRRELEVGYYRTFDSRSKFELLDETEGLYDNYFEEDKFDLDITYNYFNILLKLIQIPL